MNRESAVIIPVYYKDKLRYLESALNSIFSQTYQDFDLFVAIDGIIPRLMKLYLSSIKKPNFFIVSLPVNSGLAVVLNFAIQHCLKEDYKYIVRMDSDDISHPSRFERQIEFLKNNPNVDIVGTQAKIIDSNGSILGRKSVPNMVDFKVLTQSCAVIHPSVVIRREFFTKYGYYDSSFIMSQDYELWLRAAKNGSVIANLSEELLSLRYDNSLIARRKKEQKYNIRLKKQYIFGLRFLISVIPNILIILMPKAVVAFILKRRISVK